MQSKSSLHARLMPSRLCTKNMVFSPMTAVLSERSNLATGMCVRVEKGLVKRQVRTKAANQAREHRLACRLAR